MSAEPRSILGIPVPDDLMARWREWFAPPLQPFPLAALDDRMRALLPRREPVRPSDEVRDTFHLYGGERVWLTRHEFAALPTPVRRALRYRRKPTPVWDLGAGDAPLAAYVHDGVHDSQHAAVAEATWRRAAGLLSRARELAGTFPAGSGPNCFGTVMAAAGVAGAEHEWMFEEPFAAWLGAHTTPLPPGPDQDHEPGIVLVWTSVESGLPAHAAVTLGDGWALSKPSQAWCSPRVVWPVRRTILRSRYPGLRLERHRLHRPMSRPLA